MWRGPVSWGGEGGGGAYSTGTAAREPAPASRGGAAAGVVRWGCNPASWADPASWSDG